MDKFEIYSLVLCLIVFVLLTSLLSYMLAVIIKQGLKNIRVGAEDEEIIKEFNTNTAKIQSKFSKTFHLVLNILLCMLLCTFFLISLYINCTQNVYFDNVPTYRVVLTSSTCCSSTG